MRISTDVGDAGFGNSQLYKRAKVYLDGVEVENCVMADEEQSVVEAYVVHAGVSVMDPGSNAPKRKRFFGKVRIELNDDGIAALRAEAARLGLRFVDDESAKEVAKQISTALGEQIDRMTGSSFSISTERKVQNPVRGEVEIVERSGDQPCPEEVIGYVVGGGVGFQGMNIFLGGDIARRMNPVDARDQRDEEEVLLREFAEFASHKSSSGARMYRRHFLDECVDAFIEERRRG